MSRYIDADVLRHDVLYHANAQYCKGNHDKEEAFTYCLYLIDCMPVLNIIDEQPTADVVEVVRCKDCKFWQTDWLTSHDGYHYCAMVDIIIDGDFYCKDGERKILPKD